MAGTGGSSPHAGTGPGRAHQGASELGLIPARGDRTTSPSQPAFDRSAHPRTRGPDTGGLTVPFTVPGSSPHAGTGHRCRPARRLRRRLIPARGDRTPTVSRHRTPGRAHPRTRGPDSGGGDGMTPAEGSSPHAGTGQVVAGTAKGLGGLIPARGDRTAGRRRTARSCRAHPRTRGPDFEMPGSVIEAQGSSPHAGTGHGGLDRLGGLEGLIPARGDRTGRPPGSDARSGAHPRTRGPDGTAAA